MSSDLANEPSKALTAATMEAPSEDFVEFYNRQYAPLTRLLLGMTGRSGQAEELTQEALLSAFRNWSRVQALDRPDLWLRRVATNRAISARRRVIAELAALARVRAEPVVTNPEPSDDHVWSAVRQLPRTQAAALVLWAVEGFTLAEVGEVLGCSPETARTHLRRARERLQQTLGEDSYDD